MPEHLDVSFLRAQIMTKHNVFFKVGLDFLIMPQYILSIITVTLQSFCRYKSLGAKAVD